MGHHPAVFRNSNVLVPQKVVRINLLHGAESFLRS
jgi:hypothetical protein